MTSPSILPRGPQVPLRIGVVQLNPKISQVELNIAKARELCSKLEPHSLDILCFPEMAFTGYVFESAEHILPHLETPRIGPTSIFCKELAGRLGCYVTAGYPERLDDVELAKHDLPEESSSSPSGTSTDGSPSGTQPRNYVGANSAIIYGPSGEWAGGYRKTNLFETDMTWAKPGTGFGSFKFPLPSTPTLSSLDVPHPLSLSPALTPPTLDMAFGICMDLNPMPPALWTSAEGPYELADHCIKNNSKFLLLLNAWLDPTASGPEGDAGGKEVAIEEGGDENDDDDEPEWRTLNYWSARLMPLWRFDGRRRGSNETIYSDGSVETSELEETKKSGEPIVEEPVEEEEEEEKVPHETIVVACNRIGKENGKTFAGSSAIFSMRAGSGRPKLLDMMGKREEGVRVWNLLI